jgi:WD40 repeat protein
MPAVNPDKLKSVATISRTGIFFSIARVHGSARAFVGCSDGKIYEFDFAQPKTEPKELGTHGGYVTSVALAGPWLVSGGYDGRLVWWDAAKRTQVRAIDAHAKWIRAVTATRDGKTLVSVGDDMVARVWDADSGQRKLELRGHAEQTPTHFPSMLYACAVTPDGKYLATGDKVGHIVVWELATGKSVTTLETPVMYTWDPTARRHSIGGIRSLAYSSDGKSLAVGGTGKIGNIDHLEAKSRVEVFDWQNGERTHEFTGDKFNGLVERLEYLPDDLLLAGGGANDGFLIFYDLKAKKAVRQDKVEMTVHDFALSDAADAVYAVGHGKIAVFEMKG